MLFYFLLIRKFPFNEKFEGFFYHTYKESIASIECSGSNQFWNRSLKRDILTNPNFAINPEENNLEWCSNFNKTKTDYPWLMFNFGKQKFNVIGYSLKLGCCDYFSCCCLLYSWSLEGSNDNKTWTKIHQLEKQSDFDFGDVRSFKVDNLNKFYQYIRLKQDQPHPSCWYCIGLARMEIYGDLLTDEYSEMGDDINDNDEVSIIGKVTKHND